MGSSHHNSSDVTERRLQELRDNLSSLSRNEQWLAMHHLAEIQYIPAIDFFIENMRSSDTSLREFSLECLGFHYDLSPRQDIIDIIRSTLLNDNDANVRMTAAAALGAQLRREIPCSLTHYDPALVIAMTSDEDMDVRYAAFGALLSQRGIPNSDILRKMDLLRNKQHLPTISELEESIKSGLS